MAISFRNTAGIDRQAPVFIRREIEIFAPPAHVWEWLSRVELWSDWHPEVTSSRWLDETGGDRRFKWRKNLLGVDCQVISSRTPREFSWAGRAWLTTSHQLFTVDGDFKSTTVVCEQSLDGPGVRLLKPLVRGFATQWLETLLGALKARIEGQHERGAQPTRPKYPMTRADTYIGRAVDRARQRDRWQ